MNNKKHNHIGLFVIFGLIVLISITGCVDKEGKKNVVDINKSVNATPDLGVIPGQDVLVTPIPQGTSNSGISSDTGGMMELYNLDKLISISDSIVIAEVIDVLPSRWNTQSGEKPTIDDGKPYTIYTDANVKILGYLKVSAGNTADNANITVRTIGGTVGQDNQKVEDQPSYSINEKVLIFLKNDSDPRTKDVGNKHMITAGLIQGKISIPADNEITIGDTRMSLAEAKVIITGKGEKKYGSI